ncbi:hypothetical protein FKR81_02785 [Lentzea tibetensis]|uniref:Uncharacterized protein n=1 Tax=Lentzea tibetensis TaxID=2591470 RepID=A0A563F165_9PSEU|nr:hypothetical protein [Lentzea tibetensis]TWP53700.1 hypothetical protein FKR81_02785 [Lentzea tibetensis]
MSFPALVLAHMSNTHKWGKALVNGAGQQIALWTFDLKEGLTTDDVRSVPVRHEVECRNC